MRPARAVEHSPAQPRRALEAFEARRAAWLVAPTEAGFEALHHPALRFEHSTGRVDSAESFREFVLGGAVDYRRVSHRLLDLREDPARPGVVLATGELSTELVKGGETKRLFSTTQAEYVKDSNGWRLLGLACTAALSEGVGHG